jgi:HK97 gp10 family phage protein
MGSRIKGLDKHMARLKAMERNVPAAINEALVKIGHDIKNEAHRSIQAGSGSGRVSSPGQAPNRQSGELQDGLRVTNPRPGVVQVESHDPASASLEFGTSKMSARPFLRPARDKELRNLTKEARKAIRTTIKRR